MSEALAGLPNAQLLARVRDLVQRGNAVEAELLTHLARRVSERDGGRCSYVSSGGRRCDAREFLEFDHAEAWAFTHAHSIERITLRCRAHNQQRARTDFGDQHMRRFQRRNRSLRLDSNPVL